MINILKRRYHYHIAMIYANLHHIVNKKFHYHLEKHKEIAEQMKGE